MSVVERLKCDRYEVRLSGIGGQGLLLAGQILAQAATLEDGRNAVHTESYAPLARGAPSKSDVVISDDEVDFPEVLNADLFLAMEQKSFNTYFRDVKPDGLILVDAQLVTLPPDLKCRAYAVPFTSMARESSGKSITASILALGFISALTGVVSKEALMKTTLRVAPRGTAEINCRALEAGYGAGLERKGQVEQEQVGDKPKA